MRLSLKSLCRMTRQMATYQESFVDTRRALRSMSTNSSDSRMASSLSRVADRIEQGDSLFEAFDKEGNRYPLIFLRMTKVGEESGTLGLIYEQLGAYLEQQLAMRRRFFMQLVYPIFMVIALIFVLSLVGAIRASLSSEGSINMSKVEQIFLEKLLRNCAIVGSIVLAILVLRVLLVGRAVTDAVVLFTPGLAGAFRKLMLYRFSLSMYLMTGSAIGMPEAVRESGKATNNALASMQLDKAAVKIEDGMPLAEALRETYLFPADFIDVVEVAEESGTISESLRRVAPHYAEDAEIAMNRIVSATAWMIYLIVAGIMVYNIIKMFAGYVGGINSVSGGY